jgi:sucrose-6F-phosphate phosphohydrolase
MQEILLATDIDGTLVGDDEALQSLNSILAALRAENRLKLAYVTGRSLEAYNNLAAEKLLMVPDVLVTSCGTEIYWKGSDLSDDWPQDVDWDREAIANALNDLPELIKQPESEQRPYKISFYAKDDHELLDSVRQTLSNFSLDVLYSHQEYLDILPKDVNKGSALKYLASVWKIDPQNIVACGDSANDMDMLAVGKAVIVKNSRDELINWAASRGSSSEVYLAEQSYAAGIVEGLKNFRVL